VILREFSASKATAGVVRVYRVVDFRLRDFETTAIKLYTPRPEHCLQFFIRDKETALYPDGRSFQLACVLTGLHDQTIVRIVPQNFLFVQVAFEPTALHRLTGIPSTTLRNQYLDATTVLGSVVARINERLSEARSYVEMVGIVDKFVADLVQKGRAPRKFDWALQLLRDDPTLSVDRVAEQSSLSLRQFERRCREQVGMGPKLFARLGRFDRAFYTKLGRPERDWLTIAVDSGYVDYQHMVRDFKDFTGQTPRQAFEAQSTAPERLLGVPQEFHVTDPSAERRR
jgi:AraC-like DNA-binding protein